MKREDNAETHRSDRGEPRTQGLAEQPAVARRRLGLTTAVPRRARPKREQELTTPDLVVLSLLAERPMHGYQANLELERREIRDWAPISRTHVYYSLEKLARIGMIRAPESEASEGRPERATFETTEKGREALADALEREEWTTHREKPPFLIWLALSWQARPGVFRKLLKKRRKFLLAELARERKTLHSICAEVGHKFHEAVWMVSLMIEQLKTEIRWNRHLEQSLARRARAVNTVFAEGLPK